MALSPDRYIYVAGHRGMVGSAVVRALRKRGYTNIVGKTSGELDLRDQAAVRKFLKSTRPDAIVLAAARVGGILANKSFPADFILDNLQIQTNVIGEAFASGIEHLLFLGSSCIYPKFADQPVTEEALLTGALEPTNEPYAVAKIAGLKLCEYLHKQHGVDFRSLMPTNLYGPGDNFHPDHSHVIPGLMRRFHDAVADDLPEVTVWGSGTPRREFLHVDDLARACVHTLELSKEDFDGALPEGARHLNAGTGVDHPVSELADMLRSVTGFEGDIQWDRSKPDGTPRKLLDVSRLQATGWNHEVSLLEGLQDTYSWYTSHIDTPESTKA